VHSENTQNLIINGITKGKKSAPSAIALYLKNQNLGYVPAEDNVIISQLMDVGHGHFTAEIIHIYPHASTWEQVEFIIISHQ